MADIVTQTGLINEENNPYIPKDKTETAPSSSAVTGMANLMEEGHPLMASARNRAQEYMSGRGMAPSSIAAGAVEREAMEAAQPLVLADAATQATKERDILGYKHDIGLTEKQGEISSTLQKESAGQAQTLQLQKSEQSLAAEKYVQGMTNQRFAQEMALNIDKMNAANQEAFASATGPMFQQALSEKTRINQIPDMEMGTAAKAVEIARIEETLQRDVNFLSSIYGYPLVWDAAPVPTAAPTPAEIKAKAADASGLTAVWNNPKIRRMTGIDTGGNIGF